MELVAYGQPTLGETRFVASLPADAIVIDSITDLQQQIMGEIQLEKLTAQQGKMVLEYFARQAAEDAPADGPFADWEKHVWTTRMHASVAIDRRIHESDWLSLLSAELDYQSFDRDADAFMFEHGIDGSRWQCKCGLEDAVNFAIDNCWNNSGA